MEPTDADLKNSGAVRAVCLAKAKYFPDDAAWDGAKQWAEREFRQYSPATIDRLITLAIAAKARAIEAIALARKTRQERDGTVDIGGEA